MHPIRASVLAVTISTITAVGAPIGRVCAESSPLPPSEQVDLLIVVDSSSEALGARAALAGAIGTLIDDLEASYGFDALLSLHAGIITADLGAGGHAVPGCIDGGDGGRLQAIASKKCEGPDGNFVRAGIDEWGDIEDNFTGDLAAALSCIVPVAVEGCAFQQPLAATLAALDGTLTDNVGFLRPDAVLAVLYVTGHDDCSASDPSLFDPDDAALGPATPYRCAAAGWACTPALDGTPQTHDDCVATDGQYLTPVTTFVAELQALKPVPGRVVVGVLRGAPAPVTVVLDGEAAAIAASCEQGEIAAQPAVRLDTVAAAFEHSGPGGDSRHAEGVVCDDLAPPLAAFAEAVASASFQYFPPPDAGPSPEVPPDGASPEVPPDGGAAVDAESGAPIVDGGTTGCGCTGGGDLGLAAMALVTALALSLRGPRRRATPARSRPTSRARTSRP